MRAEFLKGHLDFLILAAVEDRPAHGYAIVEALQRRSNGTFDLPEGTVYPALHRLERSGLLASRWLVVSNRRRRVYRLTTKGNRALTLYRKEWKHFSQAITAGLEPAR